MRVAFTVDAEEIRYEAANGVGYLSWSSQNRMDYEFGYRGGTNLPIQMMEGFDPMKPIKVTIKLEQEA